MVSGTFSGAWGSFNLKMKNQSQSFLDSSGRSKESEKVNCLTVINHLILNEIISSTIVWKRTATISQNSFRLFSDYNLDSIKKEMLRWQEWKFTQKQKNWTKWTRWQHQSSRYGCCHGRNCCSESPERTREYISSWPHPLACRSPNEQYRTGRRLRSFEISLEASIWLHDDGWRAGGLITLMICWV